MTGTTASNEPAPRADDRIVCYYDDDCGMCDAVRQFFEKRDATERLLFIGRSRKSDHLHEIPDDLTAKTIVVFQPASKKPLVRTRAVAALLAALPLAWQPLRLAAVPPLVWLSDAVYRLVAANRARISKMCGLTACKLPNRSAPRQSTN